MTIKVGERIRVIKSVTVYHHPEHRSQPFDIKELEGEVVAILTEWQGRPVSANFPLQVQFNKKFRAHLRDDEVEILQ